MKLHDIFATKDGTITIVKVLGGWIYTMLVIQPGIDLSTSSVFVPMPK